MSGQCVKPVNSTVQRPSSAAASKVCPCWSTSANGSIFRGSGSAVPAVSSSAGVRNQNATPMPAAIATATPIIRPLRLPIAPGGQVHELAARLRAARLEMRLRLCAVGDAFAGNGVLPRAPFHLVGRDAVGSRRIQAEYLRAQLWRDFRIAVALAQFGRDLERAERLDLVLRRAVPDRVRAPEHVVGPAMLQQLAESVRRLRRIAHQEAPGAAEFRIDVGAGLDPALFK